MEMVPGIEGGGMIRTWTLSVKHVRQKISSEQLVFEDNLSVHAICVHGQQTERKSVNYAARVYLY